MSKEKLISGDELAKILSIPKFSANEVSDGLNYLLGRVLTIIDASIIEPKQNKSVKDLIKGEFIDDMSLITEKVCGDRGIAMTEEQERQCEEVNPLDVVGK